MRELFSKLSSVEIYAGIQILAITSLVQRTYNRMMFLLFFFLRTPESHWVIIQTVFFGANVLRSMRRLSEFRSIESHIFVQNGTNSTLVTGTKVEAYIMEMHDLTWKLG